MTAFECTRQAGGNNGCGMSAATVAMCHREVSELQPELLCSGETDVDTVQVGGKTLTEGMQETWAASPCPRMSPARLRETTTRRRSRLWEVWKCVEQITNDSNLTSVFSHHVSFIQTSCVDGQCITQKYKGKNTGFTLYIF